VDVLFEGQDKIIWSLDSKGTLSVKGLCKTLRGSNCPYFLAKESRSLKLLRKVVSSVGLHPKARFLRRSCLVKKLQFS